MTTQQTPQFSNLVGTVLGQADGVPLPGATVRLTGGAVPQMQVADAQGQFRFPDLHSGTYQLKAELEGYSMLGHPKVVLNAGRDTETEIRLSANIQA
ncbi:MAG TPA: carboxypeptidase-like regulatory domain-containing protein [Thermoanaerobaculia bacterium]|nr:carboxypeptidase-like regulatory domain-containing protein [Thermoanaerobaculia bacterium]